MLSSDSPQVSDPFFGSRNDLSKSNPLLQFEEIPAWRGNSHLTLREEIPIHILRPCFLNPLRFKHCLLKLSYKRTIHLQYDHSSLITAEEQSPKKNSIFLQKSFPHPLVTSSSSCLFLLHHFPQNISCLAYLLLFLLLFLLLLLLLLPPIFTFFHNNSHEAASKLHILSLKSLSPIEEEDDEQLETETTPWL